MIEKWKALGKFELNSILLLIISVFSGIAGYLYQIILGNILSVKDYGQANILITWISMGTTVILPICLLASRNVAIYRAEQKKLELNNFLAVIFEIVSGICAFIVLFVFVLEVCNKESLSVFHNTIFFTVVLVTNIIYNVLIYVVQGFKQFGKYGLVGLMYALVKVVVVVLGSKQVQGVSCVLLSLAFSNIICIVIMLMPSKTGSIIQRYKRQNIIEWIPKILPFYGWTFLIQILLGFITNGGDVVLVKFVFSDETSGIYAVTSNLCRIAVVGISPITAIMFTEVASSLMDKSKLKKLLNKGLVYCGVLAGIYFLLLNILGKWVVNFLYGVRYEEAAALLRPTSFFTLGIIWLNVLYQYYMALGKIKIVAVAMLTAFGVFLTITQVIATIEQMLALYTIVTMVIASVVTVKLRNDIGKV